MEPMLGRLLRRKVLDMLKSDNGNTWERIWFSRGFFLLLPVDILVTAPLVFWVLQKSILLPKGGVMARQGFGVDLAC